MSRARPKSDFITTPNYYMDWIEGGRLIANPPWTDDTQTGIYGDPTSATAEKGACGCRRRWREARKLAEVREQHRGARHAAPVGPWLDARWRPAFTRSRPASLEEDARAHPRVRGSLG